MGDATVRCWGYNGYGEIGDGLTAIDRLTPALVSGLTGAVAVAAGELGTCALRSDGTVRCWGRNDHGQVGDGTTTDRFAPAVVSGLADVASLSVGQAHACALLADGRARCWGWNDQGQLGDGTRAQRPTAACARRRTPRRAA